MRFGDLPGARFTVRVLPTYGSPFEPMLNEREAASISHVMPSNTPDVFDLVLSDTVASVTTVRPADSLRLNRALGAGRSMVAQVTDLAADGSVTLQIAFFTGRPLDLGPIEIGVDEYVKQYVEQIVPRRGERDTRRWLTEECTFSDGGHSYFFIIAGPALEEMLDVLPLDDRDAQRPRDIELAGGFCVTGSRLRFVVKPHVVGGGSIYVATLMTAARASASGALRIARGTLSFRDWSHTGQTQLQARTQLGLLTEDDTSYLKRWDEFGRIEGEQFLTRAREIGVLRYVGARENHDGSTTVQIADPSQAADEALRTRDLQELEPVDEVPRFLADPELTYEEFEKELERDGETSAHGPHGGSAARHIEVLQFDHQTLQLKLKIEHLPMTGTLVASTAGERAQIKRRNRARRAIRSGDAANPQLGLLLEEGGKVTSLRSPQRIKPLTAFVRQKVFKNPPTLRQVQAIDVALNTPDIALIQGPPGTGKTTVIAAILERLNELDVRSGTCRRGQVLLTGFQHDAVENMIDRISLNSLPVPKFGRRPGASDELNLFEKSLEDWTAKIARDLRERNPQITELEDETAINDLYRQYLRTPSHRLALALTQRVGLVSPALLGPDLAATAVSLARRLESEELLTSVDNSLALAVQRLRVRPESFADDGPERVTDALVDLDGHLSADESALLERASTWSGSRGQAPFLAELTGLRTDLLDRLTAPPVFRVEKHSDEVLALAEMAVERVRAAGRNAIDRKMAALAEFIAELESNAPGIIDSVAEFSFAFAATVQQSVNSQMQRQKGVSDDGESLEYEYVIVDEAARVSPRDLMIPMAQGKKIILVGDHRQLPHLVDEKVARQMEAGEPGDNEAEWLKKSMFQYLFSERIKELEERDGITRRVTLDKQFRMHADLGDFVSRNFYERFAPAERFDSGLPASAFAHALAGADGNPAMWIEVPASSGAQRRDGTSWARPAEAEAITNQLTQWITSPEGEGLSFGVISFYKAQADRIRALLRERLGSEFVDGHRIRVGTVDSFQGMEFDVVFLSVVRTFPEGGPRPGVDRDRQARSIFGHLSLYNRLNVSMSRQKRLLVAVGDTALVTNDLANEYIPGLVDFYQLATGKSVTPPIGAATAETPSLAPAVAAANQDATRRTENDGGSFGRLLGRGFNWILGKGRR